MKKVLSIAGSDCSGGAGIHRTALSAVVAAAFHRGRKLVGALER